jgi:hypothetical protein
MEKFPTQRELNVLVVAWLLVLTLAWVLVLANWHAICQKAALTALEDTTKAVISNQGKK